MSRFTQKAILQTFTDMLEVMPFDKITVSAIVKECGISPNTFYYHYQDIYELLDIWLLDQLGQYTQDPSANDLQSNLKSLLHACRDHSKIVYHIFNSLSRDRLERYVFTVTDDMCYQYVCELTKGRDVSPERLTEISNFCRYAFSGYFLKFLWNNMEDDIDSLVDTLNALFCVFVIHAAEESPDEASFV
ncbi:MAG: TetR/AcrR family transcriptional regulator [Oscillospiraceae bacterium]